MWLSFIPFGLSGETLRRSEERRIGVGSFFSSVAWFCFVFVSFLSKLFWKVFFSFVSFSFNFFLLISSSDQQMFFHASSWSISLQLNAPIFCHLKTTTSYSCSHQHNHLFNLFRKVSPLYIRKVEKGFSFIYTKGWEGHVWREKLKRKKPKRACQSFPRKTYRSEPCFYWPSCFLLSTNLPLFCSGSRYVMAALSCCVVLLHPTVCI